MLVGGENMVCQASEGKIFCEQLARAGDRKKQVLLSEGGGFMKFFQSPLHMILNGITLMETEIEPGLAAKLGRI